MCCSKSLARSRKGMRWPWARYGKRIMFVVAAINVVFERFGFATSKDLYISFSVVFYDVEG